MYISLFRNPNDSNQEKHGESCQKGFGEATAQLGKRSSTQATPLPEPQAGTASKGQGCALSRDVLPALFWGGYVDSAA